MTNELTPINKGLKINPSLTVTPKSVEKIAPINSKFKIDTNMNNISSDLSLYQPNSDKYKRFIDEIYPNVNLERQAAQNQSAWSKVGNMFSQGVIGEILAQGVIGGVGGLLELPDAIADEIAGRDADFSNFMTKFADNITEELGNKTPIFRYNPGKSFDWKDFGWWTSNAVSVFSTLGMLIPALGEAKAAGYFSKGLQKIAALSRLNKMTGVSKAFIAASDIFATEKYWQGLTHSAIAMRNAENMREASGVFNTLKEEAFKLFQDDEEYQKVLNSEVGQEFLAEGRTPDKLELANFIASKGAWKDYGMNAVNVIFDAMQLAPIFKGFKVKTRTAGWLESAKVKAAQANILEPGVITKPRFNASSFFKGGTVLVGEQMTEGVEELVNAISQSDANWYGKHLLGSEKDKDFVDRIHEYLQDPSSWEQAFWGFAGGVAFSGGARTIGSIKETINDFKDPHSTEMKIGEIQNRYIKLANRANNISDIQKGININTNTPFVGDKETIEQSQKDMIDRVKTVLGYDLGFNASLSGNINSLLEMVEHEGFKKKMIELGLTDEVNFSKDLVSLKKNILDAEHTFKATYNKIFTATSSKPHLRNLIINEAINKKFEVEQTTKLRNNAKQRATNLRTNNPALDALKEQNKDKDFEGTLDNLINAEVIKYLDTEVEEWGDPIAKNIAKEKVKQYKDEFKLHDKELGDNKAVGDFDSINDIIKAEAEAKVYELFLHVDNSLYEEVMNTNKSIPTIENKLKVETDKEYSKQFETFRVKIGENTKVDPKVDTSSTMDAKIKVIDDTLEQLKKDNLDPFVTEAKPTKKLNKDRLEAYIDVLEKRRSILVNQKTLMIADEQSSSNVEVKNTALVNKLSDAFLKLGVVGVKSQFTGKRSTHFANTILKEIAKPTDPNTLNSIGDFFAMLSDPSLFDMYGQATRNQLRDALNNMFNALTKGNVIEEFINEFLVIAGYITNTETTTPTGSNKSQEHINNAEEFKSALNGKELDEIEKEIKEQAYKQESSNNFSSLIVDIEKRRQEELKTTLFNIESALKSGMSKDLIDDYTKAKTEFDEYFVKSGANKGAIYDKNLQQLEKNRETALNKAIEISEKYLKAKINTKYDAEISKLTDKSTNITDLTLSVVDFTSQNPITKNIVARANRWITRIINDGTPLFVESAEHGTFFKFELIAAKYGKLVGVQRLKEDFEYLKQAYSIIRSSKIGEEGQKRIYNTDDNLKKTDVNKIIESYGLKDEFKEAQISNINNVTPTGGEEVLGAFLYNLETTRNDNGDQVVDDKDIERVNALLNSLAENSQVVAHVNTELSGDQGFNQNKNNQETIPIIIEAISGNKRTPIAAVSTLSGMHAGVKYRFNGKDWTDVIINDISTSNNKIEYIGRLLPLIQTFFNAKKMNESKTTISRIYLELIDADIRELLYDLVGRDIDIRSEQGMKAFTHIARVMFYGQNTDGVTPIELRRNEIIANIVRWKDKLTRDHIQNTKLREIIGIDIDKIVESKITYITDGTLVKSKDEKGNVKYRNLSVIDNPSKVKLFKIQNNSNKTVIENTRDKNETITKQGTIPTFASSFLVGVVGRSGKVTPVPIKLNSIDSNLIKDDNVKQLHEKIGDLIIELGKTQALAREAFRINDQVVVEGHNLTASNIITELKKIINIQHEQEHFNVLMVTNRDIRFNSNGTYFVYDFYNNKFRYERIEGNTKITKPINEREFRDELGSLERNINYDYFDGNIFTDILGNKHNSYEEYLISSNTILTDVGQLVDKNGKKISNFTLSQYDGVGGVPLIVNIDTSHLKTNVTKTPSFAKFSSEYEFDKRYDFIFKILDTFIKSGKITFNGALDVTKTDKETGRKSMVYYTPSNKSITVTKTWVELYKKNKVDATLALVHDTIHALVGTRSKEEQTKLIEQLNKFKSDLFTTPEYKLLNEKKDRTEIENKLISILNMKDVEELLTYGLTDTDFAKFLDTVKTTEGKVTTSFWAKLKQIIRELAQTFGISTKLDELNYIFEQFITGGDIKSTIDKTTLGEVSNRDEYDDILDKFAEDEPVEKPIVSFTSETKNELNNIFPDSKIKDILYHGSPEGEIKTFTENKQYISKGFFFSDSIEHAKKMSEYRAGTPFITEVVLNIINPLIEDFTPSINIKETKPQVIERAKREGYDSIILNTTDLNIKIKEYIVFKPEQIHTIISEKDVKSISYSSTVNKELTGSPFELDQEVNVLNVLSNLFIEKVSASYKGVKGKDIDPNAIRSDLVRELAKQATLRKNEGTLTYDQKVLITKVLEELSSNDRFWKYFRIHLSNQYGYKINEKEEYIEDVELLDKSWDSSDVVIVNPLITVNDQIKNLINKTYELDPNSIQIIDGKIIWRTNTNTPTGFANTLVYAERGNKIMDLMRGCLTKEDMLTALFNYATNKESVFAKSLYSIHKELSNNPDLLNAWFVSFDKAIIDSYRDLIRTDYTGDYETTELTLTNVNRNAVEYHIADKWANLIISRGENNFYDKDWIENYDKLYKETATLSSNFTKLDPEIGANIVQLYYLVGIDITLDSINYEYLNNRNEFINGIITPLRNIKGIPGVKYKLYETPYIDRLQATPKTIFNEFGNLLRLAKKVKYFREDHFSFSNINVTGNLVFDANKPDSLSNFFKKLEGGDDSVYNALINYTTILSNQHSLLLWGDEYIDNEIVKKGRGIFDYKIVDGIRKATTINTTNLSNFKSFRYSGTKDLTEGIATEYHKLTKYDWTLRNLIYYFGGGKITTKKEVNEKLTAIFPMINPSDGKNTRLFEAPIIELNFVDYTKLLLAKKETDINKSLELVREIPIFKAIYLNAIDELIAMNTAKQVLFELKDGKAIDDGNFGFVLKKEFQNDVKSGQLFYHYKLKDGVKKYLTFTKDTDGTYRLDTTSSGNIFDINNLTVTMGNKQITFNSIFINNTNFIKYLMLSNSLNSAIHTPLIEGDPNSTFKNRLEQFILRFISQQINIADEKLSVYKDFLTTAYVKKENVGREDKTFILKDKNFNNAIAEYALNTYLFNVEQVRLFYGSVADYKSNIDLNKRGRQIIANGIPSVHKGFYSGATISDVKLKSKIYRHKINTLLYALNINKDKVRISRLEKIYTDKELSTNKIVINDKEQTLFRPEEKEIYNLVSPYLSNDSANAVSFVTFDEFEKRIHGFGLTEQYSTILNKVRNGGELNREDTMRFASMQKNFYYSIDRNDDLQKMIPTQVKNAEIILTPALIKDLQLDSLNKIMIKLDIPQINLGSAEKIGSLYIATIADEDGNIVDDDTLEKELIKAKRNYNYEGLRMQLEVPDAIFEETITLSRQFAKKIIENIPDTGVDYIVNGKTLNGVELKNHYFELINSNVFQSAIKTLLPFDVRVDKDGNIIGDIDYNVIVDILEKEGIDRNLSKNLLFSVQIGDTGDSRVPIFFNTQSAQCEHILTSLFTNGVTNQKFPGLHGAQMSSLFMNKKQGVKWSDLESIDGINWHKSVGVKTNPAGKVINRNDIKLRSTILFDEKEGMVQEAEVLLPRWAKQFYKDGEYVDINTLSDEVRTMVGYRIPMEAKYSAYVFKVVGFLPDDNGPSIVLPDDFVTQTGSDFDMDHVYAFIYNLHTKVTTEIVDNKPTSIYTVERIPYTEDNNLDSRAQAIMEDHSQLVHILALKLNNDKLIDIVTSLDEAKQEYYDSLDKTSEVNKKHKPQFDKIDSINKRISKAKGKEKKALYLEKAEVFAQIMSDEAYIYFKDKVEYINVKARVKEIISSLPILEQNTRKARENQILNIYYGILTNKYHYAETIATSNFKSITESKKEIDEKFNVIDQRVNNLTFDGQQHYRDKSHQGRDLKGISLASDRFNSIAQVARIHLTERLKDEKNNINNNITLPIIEYIVNPEQKKQLIENYGKDVRFETRGTTNNTKEYAIVTHRFINNNPNNTFKNVEGQLISSYSAQTTANILDNVAFPLPRNVNEYTVNIWKMLVSLGSTFKVSTAFINQPIIHDLVNTLFANLNNVKRGSEIEQTKRKFQTLLYRVMIKGDAEHNKGWDEKINNKQSIFIGGKDAVRNQQYDYLGYKNNLGITLNHETLLNNVNTVTLDDFGNMQEINDILASENPDTNRLKEIENHLRYQLQIIETFKHYKAYSDAITDGTHVLNTDTLGAGPTFDVTHSLEFDINRTEKVGILEINDTSAMHQIFPKFFNLTKPSVYPTLEQFFIFSNQLSVKAFGEYFIGQSELYRFIKSKLNDYVTDKKYDKKLAESITSYLNNSLLKDLPWLNDISIEEKRTLLGINTELNLNLDLKNPESITDFEQLSLANQIILLHDQLKYDENHIINSLKVSTQAQELKRNRHYKVEYINNENLDKVSQSFNDLWYSENILEKIVARNLLKYEYITNGFGFGFSSFSKIIPNTVFYYGNEPFMEGSYNEKGIGLSTHLYGKLNLVNRLLFDEKDLDADLDAGSQLIFNSNYKERYIKSHWTEDKIVPDASGLKYIDNTTQNEDGTTGGKVRYFQVNKQGIISIPAKTLDNIPTGRIANRVKERQVIKLGKTTKDGVKYQLFQRYDNFVNVDTFGNRFGVFYYYPINKLEYSENEEQSVFEDNNQDFNGSELQSPDDYIGIINVLEKQRQVNEVIYKEPLPMSYTRTHDAFRDGLEQYNSTLDLVRAGERTATTRYADTGEAQKWELAKVGTYIRLKGTDEYVKVTKKLTHIDLSSLPAREEWSKKEGWDITVSHPLEKRTDLFQFEYEYIGTLQDVMKDSNTGISEEGEVTEDDNELIIENKYNWSRFSTRGYEVSSAGDKRFSAFYAILKPGAKLMQVSDTTGELSTLMRSMSIEEHYQIDIKGYNSIKEGKGKPALTDITREQQWQYYLDGWREWAKQNPELIEELRSLVKNEILTDKFATSDINQARALAQILNETQKEGQLDIKFVSYTSSTNQGINNAIDSANKFIEKTTTSYANRIQFLKEFKKAGTLSDAANLLNDKNFQKLIGQNDLANLAKGLITVLKQYDFDLNDPKTETRKGGIIARVQEFENMDMNVIISDPVVRKEFTGFIKWATSFIKGVTSFDVLTSVDGNEFIEEEKVINDLIKQLQNLIPSIKNVETKVAKLWNDFEERDLYQYTKNPEIVAGLRRIIDIGDDENLIQLKLDSLADTNNAFAALMVKKYMVKVSNGEDESSKEIGKFEALLRKTFGGRNITSLTTADFNKYLERKNGKPTGKLIQKYDWDKFYTDKNAKFKYLIKTYGRNSQSYYNGRDAWYRDNEIQNITEEEFNNLVRRKQEELSTPEFNAWKYRNVREYDGKMQFLVSDSLLSVPSDKYLNPAWIAIKDDELYQKFVEIIDKYTDYFGKATILNRGFIPSLSNEEKENITIAEKVKHWIDIHKARKQSDSFVGENNEMVYLLTVPMVNYFGTTEEIKIAPKEKDELESDYERRVIQDVAVAGKGKFNTLGAIYVENKRIRKLNDEEHAGKINYNLGEVFSQFIREATMYKVKADMKHEFDLGLYQIRNMEFTKRNSKRELLKNKAGSKALDKEVIGTTGGEGTNLEQHFAEWLEAIFYGNFDIDEGAWTVIGNMLLKFTSAKNMWFNVTAGINNVMIGKIQVQLEAFAGWYFKHNNLVKADKMYMSAIPDMLINLGSTKAGTLTNAIIKKLNIAQNTNERDFTTGMLKSNLLSWSSAYFLNDIGEHYMQNVSTLSMLDHHRIINGKIMSLAEYQQQNYIDALNKILDDTEKTRLAEYLKERYKKEEFKESKKDYLRDFILNLPIIKGNAFVEAKKELDKTTFTNFESNPKLIDAFYLNDDGYADLKDEIEIDGKKYNTKLDDNEYALFRIKALKVVQKQQGIYNKEDAATISRWVIGRMGMQFKKHVRPGWNKRFGAKFWKSFWTESRDEWNKGAYVSLFKFLASPFSRHKYLDVDEAKQFHGMMGRILEDMHHFATNIGLYWNTLDDFEKGNVKRAVLDHIYLATVLVVGLILKNLKPDDDDDENFAYDLSVYEIDKLLSEVMMFTPFGLINEGQKMLKSPAAVQGTILDTYKLISNLVGYPFQTDKERRYVTGAYAKELKIKVNAIKLVPIWNKIQQMQRINKTNKYYILFRG